MKLTPKQKGLVNLAYGVLTLKTFIERTQEAARKDISFLTELVRPFVLRTIVKRKEETIAIIDLKHDVVDNVTLLSFACRAGTQSFVNPLDIFGNNSVYEAFKAIEDCLPLRKTGVTLWSSLYQPLNELTVLEADPDAVKLQFVEKGDTYELTTRFPAHGSKDIFDFTILFVSKYQNGPSSHYSLGIFTKSIVTTAPTLSKPDFNEIIASESEKKMLPTNEASQTEAAKSYANLPRFATGNNFGMLPQQRPRVIMTLDDIEPIALTAVEYAGMTHEDPALERLRAIVLAITNAAMIRASRGNYEGFTSAHAIPALQSFYNQVFTQGINVTRDLNLYEVARFIEVNLSQFFQFEPEDLVKAKEVEL